MIHTISAIFERASLQALIPFPFRAFFFRRRSHVISDYHRDPNSEIFHHFFF